MTRQDLTFGRIREGDTVKAVVSGGEFSAMGTIDSTTVIEDEMVYKESTAFALRLKADSDTPELFLGGEKQGDITELQIL